jgi:hypothetical protein
MENADADDGQDLNMMGQMFHELIDQPNQWYEIAGYVTRKKKLINWSIVPSTYTTYY